MIQKSLFEEGSKIPSIIEKEAKQILIKKLSETEPVYLIAGYLSLIICGFIYLQKVK